MVLVWWNPGRFLQGGVEFLKMQVATPDKVVAHLPCAFIGDGHGEVGHFGQFCSKPIRRRKCMENHIFRIRENGNSRKTVITARKPKSVILKLFSIESHFLE